METVTTINAARSRRKSDRQAGHTVVLVPTMGFLHDGHLALVRRAAQLGSSVWVSVFVNPTQFGPGEDLARYPRDLPRDLDLLRAAGVDVVFVPTESEMYPRRPAVHIGFPGLDDVLCGASRPGHFAGVGLVVAKLLNIVEPQVAVFGQKDAQQALLVRRLVEDLDFPVEIVVEPTVRETDGLAMSSRNVFLSPAERRAATAIYGGLCQGRDAVAAGERDPQVVEALMAALLAAQPLLSLEYAVCVGQEDLVRPQRINGPVLLAMAVRTASARLIDNLPVTPSPESSR